MKNQPISLPRSPFQFAATGRRHSKLGLAACLLCLCLFSSTFAQSQMTEGEPASGPPVVVGAATSRGARFVAPHGVVELRLEVFSSTGEKVFDSAFRRDNTFVGANSNGAAGITNATAIGANAVVTQSDSLVLGNGANVGIGPTAPAEKLHVRGNIYITGGGPFANNNNGLILKSPDTLTCAKLPIDNAGALVTTVVACP